LRVDVGDVEMTLREGDDRDRVAVLCCAVDEASFARVG
jgi:hypothetical protein